MTSVLDSRFDLTREVGIFDDSDSTVTGGGTYQCYQRLFGRNKKSPKEVKKLDVGNFSSSHKIEPRRHPTYRATSASQAHESRTKARSVAHASASSPPSRTATSIQAEKSEASGSSSPHKKDAVSNGGLLNPDESDYSSDDPESCDGFNSYRHSAKSRSARPPRGKNYRGRSRSARIPQRNQTHENKSHHPHSTKARRGSVVRASRGHDTVSHQSRGRVAATSPESFSGQLYDPSSDSDFDVPHPRLHKCDIEHGSAREKGTKHAYSRRSKSTTNGRNAKTVEEIYVSSGSSLHDDTESDSTTGTVSPQKGRVGSCHARQSATSESSSTECPSENQPSDSKRCSKKPSTRVRSDSRVRFHPEVEVQKLPTCGVCGEPEVKCESCAKSEEPNTPTNKATVGHEPLKSHDEGQPTIQEFQEFSSSAEREAERRARSQRVYDSMFGSSTLGGGTTRWKTQPSGMAGSSGDQASGDRRDGALPPYFVNHRERGDQYGQNAAPEFETYFDDPYGGFGYQEEGGYPSNEGYTYDAYPQPFEWQGHDAYCDGPAFPYGSDPSEAAWADVEFRNRFGAHRANFTPSFANAPRGAYPTRNRSGVNAEPGQPSSFT